MNQIESAKKEALAMEQALMDNYEEEKYEGETFLKYKGRVAFEVTAGERDARYKLYPWVNLPVQNLDDDAPEEEPEEEPKEELEEAPKQAPKKVSKKKGKK